MFLNQHLEADLVGQLREAGLKVTPQRLAVLGCIAGDGTHPTAQEIYGRLRPTHPGMSFATVYNTLSALIDVGRVRSLCMGGPARFDPNVEAHHHAVCDDCGAVRDVPAEHEGPGPALPDFDIRRVERIYHGLCADCGASAGAE